MRSLNVLTSVPFLALMTLASCGDISVTPGKTVTTTRSAQNFSRIDVSDGFDVEIAVGAVEELRVEAPEGYQQYINTAVSGGRLRIWLQDNVSGNFSPRRILLRVKSLEEIEASGGCGITMTDTLRGETFAIASSGGSRFTMPLAVGSVHCGASGGSVLKLSGTAGSLVINNFSGGSRLRGFDLSAADVTVHASGGSNLEVRASDHLEVNASGGSEIYYRGHPGMTINLSGGSRVIDTN